MADRPSSASLKSDTTGQSDKAAREKRPGGSLPLDVPPNVAGTAGGHDGASAVHTPGLTAPPTAIAPGSAEADISPQSAPAAASASIDAMYNPRSLKFWAIMGCNFLALFLVALDRTILATAVPRITDEFHSLGDVGWYASAYMLTTSASQLLFGRIYKFYPTKWTFLVSVVVFEIGSAICGAASSSVVFIVGRAIAGAASAGIFTGCMLMFMMVPLHKRPMFQGLFGMTFGLASVMGPLVGGAFTGSAATWRWCFYINLPIGLVAFVCMVLWWTPPETKMAPAPLLTHIKRLDPIGSFFLLPAVVSLLLALQWGGSTYAWSSGVIIALFVLFVVLTLAFTAVQILLPDTATIPGRVITQRSVFFATIFTFFIAGAMLMCVYFLPIWFQTAQGVDPLRSGIYTLPLVLSLVVSSALSGVVTARIGYYVPSMLLCPCIMAVGEGLMSTFSPTTDSSRWIAFQFLTGFGLGFGMQAGALAIQAVLPMADVSTGIAINMFAQQLGGAVFTSVGQAILSNVLVSQLTGLGGLQPDDIVKAGITNLLQRVPSGDRGLVVGAYNFACTRIFLAAMGLSFGALLCAFFMEWRNIKKKPESSDAKAEAATAGTTAAAGDDTHEPFKKERSTTQEESDDVPVVTMGTLQAEKEAMADARLLEHERLAAEEASRSTAGGHAEAPVTAPLGADTETGQAEKLGHWAKGLAGSSGTKDKDGNSDNMSFITVTEEVAPEAEESRPRSGGIR